MQLQKCHGLVVRPALRQERAAGHREVITFVIFSRSTFELWHRSTRRAALVQLVPGPIVYLRIWEQKQGVVLCHPELLPV